MKFAKILYDKAHWIFEVDEKPDFTPDIVLVDITGNSEIKKGWLYNADKQTFTQPEPQQAHDPVPSIDQVAEETLLETKCQTFLLEMMI